MDEEKPKKKRKRKSAEGDGGHKENWKNVYASVEDIQLFLSERIFLRHNVITRRVECRIPERDLFGKPPDDPSFGNTDSGDLSDKGWQPVTDRIVNTLWSELSALKPVRVQDMYRVIESDYVPDFHPFQYYLNRLPPWNGDDYILELGASSVTIRGGVEKQMLFCEYLKKWLVGMIAGWIDPVAVNHVILVLIGEQGSYKTTWFNYLLPPEIRDYFYTKTNSARMGRDDLLTLAQYGLVCCEELDTMRPAEREGDELGDTGDTCDTIF